MNCFTVRCCLCFVLLFSLTACVAQTSGPAATPDKGLLIAPAPPAPADIESVLPFWGHRSPVAALAFSPDGQYLFSVAPGDEVIVWSPHEGTARRKLDASSMSRTLTGVLLDPEGNWVAVADETSIVFWDPSTGQQVRRIELPPSELPGENKALITAVALAGNPKFLLIGDDLGRLVVLDIEKGSAVTTYRTGLRGIRSVAGNQWAAVSDRTSTLILDLSQGAVPLPVLGRLDGLGLQDLERIREGKDDLVVGRAEKRILKWGPDFSKPARALADEVQMHDLAVDRDQMLALAAGPGGLALFDLARNARDTKTVFELSLEAHATAIDPKGLYVASAELNQIVIRRLRKDKKGSQGAILERLHHAVLPRFLMFEPGTHRFLVAGSDGRPARFDLDDPTRLDPFTNASSPIVDGALALETNGYYVTTADGAIAVFDYQKGRIARDLAVDIGPHPHIALSGSHMAIVSEARGLKTDEVTRRGELVIYDLRTDKILKSLNVTDAIDIAFAPAGARVYYAGRAGAIESWNYDNQQRKKVFDEVSSRASRLRMSPGGVQLALCGDGGVTFYNPALEVMAGARLPGAIDIAFAYDGSRAAVATEDHGVYLMRFVGDDKIETEPLFRMPTRITSLAISSDNRFLLVGESRGTVSIFGLESPRPRPLATLQILDETHWMVFTPDGAWVGNPPEKLRFDLDGDIVHTTMANEVRWREDAAAVRAALQ